MNNLSLKPTDFTKNLKGRNMIFAGTFLGKSFTLYFDTFTETWGYFTGDKNHLARLKFELRMKEHWLPEQPWVALPE